MIVQRSLKANTRTEIPFNLFSFNLRKSASTEVLEDWAI